MSLHSWLQTLRSALTPGRSQRHHGRRGSLRAAVDRPNLEALEDRALPSLNWVGSFPVGTGALAVATADFNNDGHLDLATANQVAGTVSVLLGDGRGGFGPASHFAAGAQPVSVAAGDFNHDGHPDLATVNAGSDDASVLLGDGDGAFRPPVRTAIRAEPKALAAADFNADGYTDLVYSSSEGSVPGSVEVLLGDGGGGFAARHRYDVRSYNPAGLAVADLNIDGRPDVVTANTGYDGALSVLLGNGDGTLSYDWYSNNFAAVPSMDVAVGDFTGDGIPDLVATSWSTTGVAVLPGRGDGTFAPPIRSFAPLASALVAADFSGDGRLDVLTVDAESDYGTLLLGRGDATFEWPDWLGGGTAVEAADFNADGRPDVAVAQYGWDGDGVVNVLLNDGDWPPSVSVGDATVMEGNGGTVSATFTVTLTHASAVEVTVQYATADGTAAAGTDYQDAGGTLTFAPGETSKAITVLVNGDRLHEPNETFFVNLSGATNATVADGQGAGTVFDDEPRISITDVIKKEGRKGKATLFTFTASLAVAYNQPVTVSFQTVNGSAQTSDSDYVAQAGTLTFLPGETTKTITIEVTGDSKREADEYFYLDLFDNSGNSLLTKSRGTGTILNDD